MYAPTQGPVNTGFAQTVIDAKATGSALKRGQLVVIGFNADGVPTATLTDAAQNVTCSPVGVAGEDINQGFVGSVIIAGVADVLINTAGNTKTSVESGAGRVLMPGTQGTAVLRDEQFGIPACGITTEVKAVANDYVPMAFSAYSRVQASSFQTGNISAVARYLGNTHIPQPGQANRITIEDSWDNTAGAFVTTYKESFYQAINSSGPTGDVVVIDPSGRNGVREIYSYGGYLQDSAGAKNSLPYDGTLFMGGFQIATDGTLTFKRATRMEDSGDGYFVWVTYAEIPT